MVVSRSVPSVSIYQGGTALLFNANARLLKVRQSAGGGVKDSAEFEVETLARSSSLFANSSLRDIVSANALIDIVRSSKDGTLYHIHRGKIIGGHARMTGTDEQVIYKSRFDKHLFGLPFGFVSHNEFSWDGTDWVATNSDTSAILNPVVDGRTIPNRVLSGGVYGTAHPESLPRHALYASDPTSEVNDLDYWGLDTAVNYLLNEINGGETYVANPTLATLQQQLGGSPDLIRNYEIKIGQHLPDVLDRLLEPFGFTWVIEYLPMVGGIPQKPTLKFIRRGYGDQIDLLLQPYGATLDVNNTVDPTDMSEVAAFDLNVDATNQAVNFPYVMGDFKKYESTFELVPGWDPAYDDVDWKELRMGSSEMDTDQPKRRVHRDWVLNEGGDYYLFPRLGSQWEDQLAAPYDFTQGTINGGDFIVYRRRRFLPTHSVEATSGQPAGSKRGVKIEIWNGEEWNDISKFPNVDARLLTNECGIRFGESGDAARAIKSIGMDTVKVRVTAVVESDRRLFAVEDATANSLLGDPVVEVIDMKDRFKADAVELPSVFSGAAGILDRSVSNASEADTMADQIAETWNQVMISGTITIEGCDWNGEYIGNSIRSIQTRNISLKTVPDIAPTALYPTAVAVDYDWLAQKTRITLQTFRRVLL